MLDAHRTVAWVAIVGNGVAGVYALAAWRVRRLRDLAVWVTSGLAEAALLLQVVLGVILVSDQDIVAPRFHMFYGFVAFIAIGLAYSYRTSLRGRLELFYGLVGLFLMGLGIRAFTLV